jgi:hypothetical protein
MGVAVCGLDCFWEGGKAGNFGFVPICYIKTVACKHPGIPQIIIGKNK